MTITMSQCPNKSKNLEVKISDSNKSSRLPSSEIVTAIQKPPVQVVSTSFPVCRICQTNTANEILISPCHCKGSLAYIHLSCLERWLNQSGRNFCELCKFHYDATETQRYSLCEGLWLWICHPRNRRHIRSDFIIGLLLTLVTAGLLFICVYGMDYFIDEANKIGVEKMWIKFTLISFLIIIMVGYLVSMYLLLRDHYIPWYNWWTRTVNIRLRIPEGTSPVLNTWNYNNAYIMNPKSYAFESSTVKKMQLKGHLNGFIVKVWQWSEHYQKVRPTQKVNKRSIVYTHSNQSIFSVEVSESVLFITFNDTDVQVINASFTKINQICKKDETNCQPSVDSQKDSLLIEDLDHDSTKEVVSFYSSYEKKEDDWHLISYLKVLRLEEELPTLYGNK